MTDMELIRALSLTVGVSGNEEAVRRLILEQLPGDCETETDPLGNLIVTKKGEKLPKGRLCSARIWTRSASSSPISQTRVC